MSELDLLVDLHLRNPRQGPGSDADTLHAFHLTGVDVNQPLAIADLGCGTGASSLCLASHLPHAHITAVDFLPEFLAELENRAGKAGLDSRITTCEASMDSLPLAEESLELIWSEGAVYNIGFERGIREWKRYLKPGGILVVSEITWLTSSRPDELQTFWDEQYPEIDTASGKISVLEQNGYVLKGYFPLSLQSWMDTYYRPLQAGFSDFLARQHQSIDAVEVVEAEKREMDLFQRHHEYVSYGVYVAEKLGE